jgi:hypothetical protein
MNSPAQSLDDLPSPGVAISRDRWLELIAKEARLAELYRDTGADRAEELADLSRLVAENVNLRDVLRTYNITVPESKSMRGTQPCSH